MTLKARHQQLQSQFNSWQQRWVRCEDGLSSKSTAARVDAGMKEAYWALLAFEKKNAEFCRNLSRKNAL